MRKPRRAEVVGAGFAGLAAACALAQRGWQVRVHERADQLRTTGAGIYVYENGLRVLQALGAYEDAVAGALVAHTRETRDHRNRVVSVHRWGAATRVFSIVRQNVINALAAPRCVTASRSCSARKGSPPRPTAASCWPMGAGCRPISSLPPTGRIPGCELARATGQAPLPAGRLHSHPHGEHARGARRRWRHHGRVLVGQPARPLHAVQSDRPLYRADDAGHVTVRQGDADPARRMDAFVPPSRAIVRTHRRPGRYDRFEYIKLSRWSSGQCRGDRGCGARPAAEHRPRRRLRHDERPRARGSPRSPRRCAVGARRVGADRTPHHGPYPARIGVPRDAHHVAARLRSLFFSLAGRSKWLIEQRTRTARHTPTGTTGEGRSLRFPLWMNAGGMR